MVAYTDIYRHLPALTGIYRHYLHFPALPAFTCIYRHFPAFPGITGIIVVGRHGKPLPGPDSSMLTNITTLPEQVAQLAFDTMLRDSELQDSAQHLGLVRFNDRRFSIANSKTAKLKKLVYQCGKCELLEVVDISIGQTIQHIPDTVIRLILFMPKNGHIT